MKKKRYEKDFITPRQDLTQELERTRLLFGAGLESPGNSVIFGVDRNYCYMFFNSLHKKRMKEIFGTDIAVGKSCLDCITVEENRVNAKDNYDRALSGESHNHVERLGLPEQYSYHESFFNPIYDRGGEIIGATAFAIEITERVRAEQALSLSQKKYEALFRNLSSAFSLYEILYDNDGRPRDYRYIAVNPGYEKMTGVSASQLLGKTLLELFPKTETVWLEAIEEAITKMNPKTIQNYTVELDKWFEITMYSTDKNMLTMVGTDITEKKNAQHQKEKLTEQLHQSQKMEAVGQLAGGIAHDFNNSLGGILNAAELIKSGDCSEEERDKYLDMIITAADRAGDLTKKLLQFSRKGSKASTAIDMFEIVNDTVDLLGHVLNRNITISIDNEADHSTIIGDNSLLQNAMMNIAINAGNAMPNGGGILFELRNMELDDTYCSVSAFDLKPGEYLELSIADTGCGMTPKVQSRIFEPFFTTKEQGKGTGLGLATVFGTVSDHGGAITVYSEVGIGTVFHLYFPVTPRKVVNMTGEAVKTGSGTILLMEDEELIRLTAKVILGALGYNVICADNGREGVRLFREMPGKIDLIILDMIMPVMGGREAFEKIREIDGDVPVIISSGFAKDSELDIMDKRNISGFLHKPFHRSEIAEMVARVIRDHSQS